LSPQLVARQQVRLRLGIRLAQTRSTALSQLATELPAADFARTLGIHVTVAVAWERAAVGGWGAYAAAIGRRGGSGASAPSLDETFDTRAL